MRFTKESKTVKTGRLLKTHFTRHLKNLSSTKFSTPFRTLRVLPKAGKTDTELVLEKLTYATETSVAEVVNVINRADTVGEAEEIVD